MVSFRKPAAVVLGVLAVAACDAYDSPTTPPPR
jgi:hypothetical protein